MNKMKSGIYMWTSPSGKKYIGQSTDLVKRYNSFLRFNCSYGGVKINNARKKYHNRDEWTYVVLERCDIDALDERERYYIALYDTMNNAQAQQDDRPLVVSVVDIVNQTENLRQVRVLAGDIDE